ncbi:MAG: hypothetical protein HN350_09830 [Phycisphaerales bacterium]|nr:hypothetical protein [Phycisphaerales bacterium]
MRKMICLSVITMAFWFCSAAQAVSVGGTWRYTTEKPPTQWNMPGAKGQEVASGWKTGCGGFGRLGRLKKLVKTPWSTPDIWMRATYTAPKGLNVNKLSFEVFHDEGFEIYINGVLAASGQGHRNNYALFAINPSARKAIKTGENLIAVHCRQTVGGQFIDVGLTTKSQPRVIPSANKRPGRTVRVARKIADTKYARKADWAETMTATRTAIHAAGLKLDIDLSSAVAREFWRDFPRQTDWLMQDSPGKMDKWVAGRLDGKGDMSGFLKKGRDADLERGLIGKVLGECGAEAAGLRTELAALAQVGPDDPRWLKLYARACRIRRRKRLASLLAKTNQIIFARHHNMGGGFFAYTEYTTWKGNKYGGLFMLDLANEATADGKFAETTALIKTEDRDSTIRDPELSYDAKRVLFAWRDGKQDRFYKIYERELATGKTRLITGGGDDYGASYDPVYLPDGNILFNSTRVIQSVDCAGPDVANLYVCDKDGEFARRVGFDQVHTLSPSVMPDGRVVYMRWDYNDRSQIYTQCLMQMNPDGTAQTEYYGNNTFEPTTFFHPRGIPGTSKVMVALGGHHNPQCGKLGVIDNSKGRQGVSGVIELPSGKQPTYRRADAYAQTGDMYQYPYPLDESTLLVSYDPIAYHLRERGVRGFNNKEHMRFHVYFMTYDGKRELLAADSRISSCQPIPVIARKVPHVRPSSVDYTKDTGRFYLQDIYLGPGLKGIARGTIKKLRVVELRFREMSIGRNSSRGKGGGASVITPISVGTGSWDVKVILGDATVHEDGSAMFEAPARTPVYFQALNEKNQVIQTMRSWATLMPGESFSCVGCHENKNDTPKAMAKVAQAMKAGPEKLKPFYGSPRGFSFPKEIQPILNKHCIKCHNPDSKKKSKNYDLTGKEVLDAGAKRKWLQSYITLTNTKSRGPNQFNQAQANELVNWISNSSVPTMIPPQYGGSTRSKMITMLEKGHNQVKLTREEMDKLCAWIDLAVPFCGDSMEANAWNEGELKKGAERMKMRRKADQRDLDNIKAMLQAATDKK